MNLLSMFGFGETEAEKLKNDLEGLFARFERIEAKIDEILAKDAEKIKEKLNNEVTEVKEKIEGEVHE